MSDVVSVILPSPYWRFDADRDGYVHEPSATYVSSDQISLIIARAENVPKSSIVVRVYNSPHHKNLKHYNQHSLFGDPVYVHNPSNTTYIIGTARKQGKTMHQIYFDEVVTPNTKETEMPNNDANRENRNSFTDALVAALGDAYYLLDREDNHTGPMGGVSDGLTFVDDAGNGFQISIYSDERIDSKIDKLIEEKKARQERLAAIKELKSSE